MLTFILLSGASPFLDEEEDDQKTMANVSMSKYDFDYEEFDCVSSDAKVQPSLLRLTSPVSCCNYAKLITLSRLLQIAKQIVMT